MNFPTGAMWFCYSAECYRQKAAHIFNIFYGLSLQDPKINGGILSSALQFCQYLA
jgi:hypothetical protein